MSGTVLALRARPEAVIVGEAGAETIAVRVQMPELWDTIVMRCAPGCSVAQLKSAALQAFGQRHHPAAEYVCKLRGHEIRYEGVSLREAGARDGSTILLTFRHRRPVR